MHDHLPSKTAFRVAIRRAVHQLVDDPKVLDDPLAIPILGPETAAAVRADPHSFERPGTAALRAFIATRSRFAEDELAAAYQNGVRQDVVLGAGLDTFAYRNPFDGLHVIEVDHPATQAWKRDQLAAAAIAIPASMRFVPVDFAKESLALELARAGFDSSRPAFFSWLGVVPYLTRDVAFATLQWVASLPAYSGVVFDYGVDPSELSVLERMALDALATRVARSGEPFQLFFRPAELAQSLREMGFHRISDLGGQELHERYFGNRKDGLTIRGKVGRMMSATV